MPQLPRPSYEDLDGAVRAQAARIGEIEERVGRLAAENEELRRRLGSNSSNSSRPPSSDSPYGKPKPKRSGMRGRSGRRPGKQPGEPGVTRRQVADPNERIRVEPGCCAGCGDSFADAPVVGVQKRQVFEASPPPPPRVIEYQVVARRCRGCGRLGYGQAPAWVSAPVLRQLAGLAVSVGFLVAARRRAVLLAEPFMARVRLLLHQAGLLHVDETPARVDGALTYLHVACNSAYTVMHTGG